MFENRIEAGRRLAQVLEAYAGRPDVVVLALPRGGVPVGLEVARALQAPLDVFVVRKLGVPGNPELALGAIASGGVRVLNTEVLRLVDVSMSTVDAITERERRELERREHLYRGARPAAEIAGRTVIIVDDGLATGASMRAAVQAVRGMGPSRIVVAVPTAARDTCVALRREADEVICVETPELFYAVGGSYIEFEQITDDDVHDYLEQAPAPSGDRAARG
jgi:putative phosphoribosyl transferase